MRIKHKIGENATLNLTVSRLLSRSMLFVIILLLPFLLIPEVMTLSSNLRMTLDAKQLNANNVSGGYSLTLHLINSFDNMSSDNAASLNNSLDGTDFSSLYELVVIRETNNSSGSDGRNIEPVIESNNYKYFGVLQFPINFDIVEYGNYIFRLSRLSDGTTLSEVSFNYNKSIEMNNPVVLPNNTFDMIMSNLSYDISYNSYINQSNCTSYASNASIISTGIPNLLNCSNVNLTQNNSDNLSLTILDKCSNVYTELDKESYMIGEPVQISFSNIFGKNVDTELTIVSDSSQYRFVGDLSNAAFVPTESGNYTIYLTCDNVVVFNKTFSVTIPSIPHDGINEAIGESYTPTNMPTNNPIPVINSSVTWKKITIKGSRGQSASKDVRMYDIVNKTNNRMNSKNQNENSQIQDSFIPENISENVSDNYFENISVSIAGSVDIGLSGIGGTSDSNLRLNNLILDQNDNLSVYIEDVPKSSIEFQGNVIASYAMDLSNLNFSNGTFTKTAFGKELWKCAAWDFIGQFCNGTWTKLMDIEPGAQYVIPISPEDPGYIETGVATVNTLKSLYYPGEDVNIVMVVLDTEGYLVSQANVILTIIAPDNTTTVTSTNDYITTSHKGIYDVGFTGTSQEGQYALIVKATGPDVNSTMVSEFKVSSNHSFDILRQTPVTIDPNKGPFTSELTIISNIDIPSFSYTEILPKAFNVTYAGNGIVSSDSMHTYIAWYGLTNNSIITYSAQTPLEIPNVYEIGPGFVNYSYAANNHTFYESRPWFMAIDPTGNLNVILVSPTGNISVVQNSTFNFSVNVSCVGGDCGDVKVTLDPTTTWWNIDYKYRKLINITNNNSVVLKQNYSVMFYLNTTGSNFSANGSDVRIAYYQNGFWTELDRVNESAFNSSATEIWFKLQNSVAANGYDDNYYVYYSNNFSAGVPPTNKSKVYLWFDDFNRSNKADITTEASYGKTNTGTWNITNNMLVFSNGGGDPNKLRVLALGNSVDDVDIKIKFNATTFISADATRFGLSQYMNDVGGVGRGYVYLHHNNGANTIDFLNDGLSWGSTAAYALTTNVWYYMRFQITNVSGTITPRGKTWRTNVSEPVWSLTGNFGGGAARGHGYVGIAGANNNNVIYFDDLQIRLVLPNEPNSTLGPTESNKGIVPMNSGTPFYTTNNNPVYAANNSCLWNMTSGQSCLINWMVNATGPINTSSIFYAFAESQNYSVNISTGYSDKINVTISSFVIPSINTVQCYKQGTGWTSCTNIVFNSNFTDVRANCTTIQPGASINNVSFILTNLEHNKTYFNITTVNTSLGYWYYNITDILIQDSGNFSLYTLCYDSNGKSNFNQTNWTVSWGNITSWVISPGNVSTVAQNFTFNITFNVSCVGGECGGINISLANTVNGTIKLNSGTPFYTTTANPVLPQNNSCLTNFIAGSSCLVTWIVNSTGNVGTSWLLYTNATSLNFSSNVGRNTSANINITILSYIYPSLNSIQCYKQGTGWTSCTNILFNSNFTDVRANCSTTQPSVSIANVSFILSNTDQNKTYFSVVANSTLNGYWYYNITDILVQDSGNYSMDMNCTDSNNKQTFNETNWTVPWGNITVLLISPNSSMNVTRNRFFNFTVNISCIGGQCGDASIVLDPATSWWDGRWVYRKLINVTNNNTQVLKQNYSVKFTLNTTGSNFLANGNDVRIVYNNGTAWNEIDRINETAFNLSATEIWFKLQANIAANGYNDNYYVYYGNRFANTPPSNKSKVYLWFDDFNRPDKADIATEPSYGEAGNGGWAISGNRLLHTGGTADPTKLRVIALGTPVDDVDMKIKINVTNWAGGSDNYRFGLSQDMDDVGGAGRGYNGLLRNALTQSAFLNDMVSWGTTTAGTSSVTLNNWYYMRYQSINNTNPGARLKTWPATISEPPNWNLTGNYVTNTRGKGYVGIMGALVATVQIYIDDLQIRLILPNEPNATLGAQEQGGKGDIPVGFGTPFYTINSNPYLPDNNSCLSNMFSGKSCSITWTVNATGNENTSYNFFTYAYSLNFSSIIQANFSSSVNITIMGNIAPAVQSAILSPSEPVFYENINCTFNVTDQNIGDPLSATVNWYRNGIFILSSGLGITDGQYYTSSLSSSYLTAGDVWNCGIVPYDSQAYGTELLSNNVTILASVPPKINNIECLRNGAVWVSCSNIIYGNTISKVRANCTSKWSYPISATFNLTNNDDSNTFFYGNTTDNSTGYWMFDNSDLVIADSGVFNMSVTCTDFNGTTGKNNSNWTVPWGILSVALVNPSSNVNVTQYKLFNFTSKVTCVGGECGYINATIDPINWWNNSWNYRRTINLTERANRNLTDYQFNVTLDTQSLIAAGKMNSDCSDIRFVTNNTPGILLNYWNETNCNSANTLIWVKYNLSALAFNTIYLYYGNPNATNYSDPWNTLFLYEDMKSAPSGGLIGNATYVSSAIGMRMTEVANNLNGWLYYYANPGVGFYGRYETWAGGGSNPGADSTYIAMYDRSVSGLREDIVDGGYHFTVDEWQRTGNTDRIAFTKSTTDNGGSIAQWTHPPTRLDDSNWHVVETYFYMNGTAANALIYYDAALVVNGTDPSPQNISAGIYFAFGARTGGSTNEHRIRQIRLRKFVRPEPLVGIDPEIPQAKGDIPMYAGNPFYTTTANPMLPANNSCQANMKSGDTCNSTWTINATGMLFIPWEFFVTYKSLNYSGKVIDNATKIINVTIIGNLAPVVSSITLGPNYPLPSENLNCSFTITDANSQDVLTANVTWYRNNIYYSSSIVNVTNGVSTSAILGSGNLTLGESWKCGARPFDQLLYGPQVNSSNQTIVNSKPPSINKIECYINNSIWTNCSKLGFYSNFSGVRINCTTAYRPITNVTFNFSNTPDAKLFFQNSTYTNVSAIWTFLTNVTINDSGEFVINAVCMNNESAYDLKTDNWTVPWGKIAITLIDPNSNGFVEYNKFFNFTVQVQCVGGECGNVSAVLDPESGGGNVGKIGGVKTFSPMRIIIDSEGYDLETIKTYEYYQSQQLLDPTKYADGQDANSNNYDGGYECRYLLRDENKINLSGDNDIPFKSKYSGNPNYPNGLITINTNKSEYILGESAEIYLVKLDGKGDLSSDDNLTVVLSNPDNTQSVLSADKIFSIRDGIYSVRTDRLWSSGKYTINAKTANGLEAVNTFDVKKNLDYEIIRESPLALNPWSGDDGVFENSIKIRILNDCNGNENFTFTEVIPSSLEVIDSNNGAIWQNEKNTYITWSNLKNNSKITYVAKAQKLSPDKYYFRSFISVKGKIFEESRPWIIAVDPTRYYSAYAGSYSSYTTSGAPATGGTYTNTINKDCSGGTCTSANSYVTGLTGIAAASTCMMNVTLLYNISDIKPIYLNNLTINWGGCWHSDATLTDPRCNNLNPPSFTPGTGGGFFDMWINKSGTFEKLDCINSVGDECGPGSEINLGTASNPPSWGSPQAYYNYKFENDMLNSSYVGNGIIAIRWRTRGDSSCGNGGTNILMAIDYANLSIGWNYLIKNGTNISMVTGTEPFYTITANPYYPSNDSCLASMISGKACNITWQVNATGGINTTHVFYVVGDAMQYSSTVAENISKSITLTIRDTSKVPPTVTLNSPANNNATQDTEILFNCSATDNSGLVNMTLYGDFSGTFMEIGTNNISGLSNTTTFSTTLSEGKYLWNCMATDIDGNTRFAASNRTLTIDYTAPTINLSYPIDTDNLSTRTVTFNFSVMDNLDSSMVCNLTLDSVVEHQNFAAGNGSLISKTVYNLSNNDHYWNVTCIDDAGNINTSETRLFTILSTPPVIVLQTVDKYMTNQSNVTLYYFADDGGYIVQADLYINGALNDTNYTITTGDTNSFTVVNLSEGVYTWAVNVTNNGDLTNQSPYRTFYVDLTPPSLNVSFPLNNYNTSSSTVIFNFTTIDKLDSMMACKITINGVDVLTGINANNNSLISKPVPGIKNGLNYWNITCVDDAGNFNTSDTRVMNVSALPTVSLNSPANLTFQKSENITLSYTPSAGNNVSNCTLILNGAVNQTNNTVTNNAPNNFKLYNLPENNYNWSVNCTDGTGYVGSSATRIFTVDKTAPSINLTYPIGGITVYGSTTTFNYTAYDNLDSLMTCSLIIDYVTNKTGIPSPNGQWVNVTVAVAEGNHTWSVNCTDRALNIKGSTTANFTVIGAPTVTPIYPAPYINLNYSTNVNFTYIPASGNTLINATLYINGVANQTVDGPSNGEENYFYLNFTNNGKYTWNVLIFDNQGINGTSATRTFYIDTQAPVVGIISPTNGQNVTVNNVSFRFNVTDNIISPIYCNASVSGGNVSQLWENISVANGSTITRYLTLFDGSYNWTVTCFDNASNGNIYNLINFTVFAPPNITLNSPIPNYRTRLQNITFNYTPKDDIGLDNCVLVLNDIDNQSTSSVSKNVPNYFNITDMNEGDYNWTVRCTDSAPDSNVREGTTRNFTIDLTAPSITMIYPGIDESINTNTIKFNWTATDYPVNLTCMLYLDGIYNRTMTQLSGTYFTPTLTNFTPGAHNWSLNCSDDLNNSALSPLMNFTVNNADLYIDNNRINFNNTNPNENQMINISANVTNIGGVPASGVLVVFYDGNPGAGGIYIGNATSNINVNASVIFSALWNISAGYHTIYVSVDPNDAISELSELNNNATKNISILKADITSPLNGSMFVNPNISVTFNLQDYTGGLINYSVYVDNVLNGQTGQVTDNIDETIDVAVAQGTHSIKIEAIDALGRKKNSTAISMIVDYTAPNSTILTLNNTWYNNSAPIINITSKDNIDTNINYSIYVNDSINTFGNLTNGTSILVNLSIPTEGYYQLIMEAFDDFNNTANSTPKYIYVDWTLPSINMNSPNDGSPYTVRTVILNYTPNDNLAYTLSCNVTLDGAVVASQNVGNGNSSTYTANNLVEGTHYWNVTCIDQALNRYTSPTQSFDVFMMPIITLVSPPNNNWSRNSTNIFLFNISDETGLQNCSLLFYGVINVTKTDAQLINNATNNFTLSGMSSGIYNWSIECYDNTTYHSYNITNNRTLNVDTELPEPYIETLNNSWFSVGNPSIKFNITDNMDLSIDYTFYVNGTPNVTGSVSNSSSISVNLVSLSNGTYTVVLEGADNAGNRKNSTPTTIYVDGIKPNIMLTNPLNDTNVTVSTLELNFTPSDNMASVLVCNLTLDGSIIANNLSINSGDNQNVTVYELLGGYHYWNVTCIDQASNKNTSQTYRFYVVMPDLYIDAGNITFSNDDPAENETINVTAKIYNIGLADAQNFSVEMHVNSMAGPLIYSGNISLAMGTSTDIVANYTLLLGDTKFYVLVDTPLATNGTIRESNESNNNASNSIHVGLWEYVAGTTNDRLVMSDLTNQTIYDWLVSNASGSKIFAVDIDSNINWRNLQALGENISNMSSNTDFATLDTALGSATFSDSVNRTYTSSGNPIELTNYTIYTKRINNIPIVNSTNNSNFKTGILWDYSDGGTKYTGTQDILFVSPINKNTQGYNATVDYELRIPATLRSYKAGQDLVVFYAEIN